MAASDPGTFSADDYRRYLPTPPLLSSLSREWPDLEAETVCSPPMEATFAPKATHTILLFTGKPHTLTQKRGGREATRRVLRGDTMIVPTGEASYWRWDSECCLLQMRVAPETVQRIAQSADMPERSGEIVSDFGSRDAGIQQVGTALLEELRAEQPGQRLYVDSLTNLLVLHLLRVHSAWPQSLTVAGRGLSPRQLRQTIDYIHGNLGADLSLADIAGVTGLSESHFRALFRNSLGLPVYQYVMQERMEQARTLLRSGCTPGQTAQMLGFSDQSQFTRQFKRWVGVTPGAFQRSM